MAAKKLLINASNIHSGGASILLNYFLDEANFSKYTLIKLAVDSRCVLDVSISSNLRIIRVKPTLFARIWNEIKICLFDGDLFCFGNIPPFFSRATNVSVFLHNALYFEPNLRSKFNLKTRLRLFFETLIFRFNLSNASNFLVQTQHMKRYLCDLSVSPEKIIVAPFAKINSEGAYQSDGNIFICVSSGDPHKNIANLLLAWKILAKEGLSPMLMLTIPNHQYKRLVELYLDGVSIESLNIQNLGCISHNEICEIYKKGATLIFPSLVESLGLPLVEAREIGIDIIAPERDYVRDIVSPVETFDPLSPLSISRAVKRYLKVSDRPNNLFSPTEVLQKIF